MSTRLQLDVRHLSLWRRHLVNAYEVKAGIGVVAGKTVWSMPEHLECEVLQKERYINPLIFRPTTPLFIFSVFFAYLGASWLFLEFGAVRSGLPLFSWNSAGVPCWEPAQSPPRCTKCNNPPINGQCTNHCIAIWWSVALRFNVVIKGLRILSQ